MVQRAHLNFRTFYFSSGLIWAILALGVFLRIRQYASNHSLWRDEAALAISFVTRSFSEMFEPLQNGEVVPFGFLMAEKFAVHLLGPSEYALRFFPLIAGILALGLFYRLLVRMADPRAVPLALALFAVCAPLVYFSAETKQYSFDALAVVLILLMTVRVAALDHLKWKHVIAGGLCGFAAVWFSHPSIFLLAAAGTMLLLDALRKKRDVLKLGVMFGLWLTGFAASYFFARRYLSTAVNDHLMWYWQDAFMPLSLKGISWGVHAFVSLFEYGGFVPGGLVLFAWLAGVVRLVSQKKITAAGLLVLPIVFAMIASAFRFYPFSDRLLLFVFPLLILVVAEGAVLIGTVLKNSRHYFLAGSWVVLILAVPFLTAAANAVKPKARGESIRPLISYLKEKMQPDDELYVYSGSIPGFEYYSFVDRWAPVHAVKGVLSRNDVRGYINDVGRLAGKPRVWFIFSHVVQGSGLDERKFILTYLDGVGKRIDRYEVSGRPMLGPRHEAVTEAVYLYDLRQDERPGTEKVANLEE